MIQRFLDLFRLSANDERHSQEDNYPQEAQTNTADAPLSSSGALLASADPTDHSVKISVDSLPPTYSPPRYSRSRRLQRSKKMDSVLDGQTTMMMEKKLPQTSNDFCLPEEGPLYALQLASRGKFPELERRILRDKSELLVRDKKGKGLMHYATRYGHIPMLDFLLSQGTDINLQDFDGNTPLHTAVETDQKLSLDFLLAHEANPIIQNGRHMAPIHLAVELNNTQMLQALLNHDSVDPNLGGENGATPLHYAAWKDHPDCARILLKHNAHLCAVCDIGLTPMHVAAQNSSSATLELLIEFAEKRGCGARAELLAKMNQEKNTPLHAAISGGNTQIVKMCLIAGAQIDAKQENGSTPVHLASSQGALDMIKLMFAMQPSKKAECLDAKDNMGLTPLHMAAMFDRIQTVKYLIEEGAEIDSKAEDGQTPLLLAASKGAWSSTFLLLRSKADITVRDSDKRNILHLIIRGGGQPSQFECTLAQTAMTQLLNEPDQYGCTPLHYASKQGLLTTIDKLLQLGAHLNAKNNKKQSALHFAARYGRYNSCRRLISNVFGTNIVNEADGNGQTALHAAAANGHVQVVRLLLQSGAGIFRDINGNNALHLAAMNGYTHTMSAILNVNSHLLDSLNKNKDTCLHLATVAGHANVVTLLLDMGAKILLNKDLLHFLDLGIKHGKKDVCVAIISHDRWREAMDMHSTLYGCPMVGMIQYMPEGCQMILDRCRIPSGPDQKDNDFHYTFDFKYMQVDVERLRKLRKNGIDVLPMFAVNMMVKYNRVECLSHPICSAFLAMKWRSYGLFFHLLNVFVYFAYVCCLTGFVVTYDFCYSATKSPTNLTLLNDSTTLKDNTNIDETQRSCKPQSYVELREGQKFLVIGILLFVVMNVIKEVLQMIQQKMKYVKDPNNRVEWVLYISTTIFIAPFLVNSSSSYQWQFGAIAVYLAWFNCLLFLQRFSRTGIYIVMFLEILRTLCNVIAIFSVLIVAFGLAFFVILNTGNSAGFSTPPLSIISTIIMMLGNIDYRDVWVVPLSSSELPNAPLAFIMLAIFVLLMPILLINLLIGLAVGDIEAIQKNACLKRIAMQVQLHTELEQKLPSRLLKLVDKPFVKVYPNRSCSTWQILKNRLVMEKGDGIYGETRAVLQDETMEYNSFLYSELNKQKMRLKQMGQDMKKQHELLRLIVQKMEIHTEADDVDEDSSVTVTRTQNVEERAAGIGWSSAALRHVILKQALIVSKWKKSETD